MENMGSIFQGFLESLEYIIKLRLLKKVWKVMQIKLQISISQFSHFFIHFTSINFYFMWDIIYIFLNIILVRNPKKPSCCSSIVVVVVVVVVAVFLIRRSLIRSEQPAGLWVDFQII